MLMLKRYVELYYHGENTNTNAYPWVSRLPQMFFKTSCLSLSKIWNTSRQVCYLDDLLILTNSSFKVHLLKLEMALERLSTAGMRVNISKSKFFAEQIEYLGYWITRQGIQPISSTFAFYLKIKALCIRIGKTQMPLTMNS
jgi:hypothetical protein